MTVRVAQTDEEMRACFPVMVQLRDRLSEDEFVARVQRQRKEGYELAYLVDGGHPVAVAGFRVQEMLFRGRFMYVDDLVTDARARSRGHGAALLEWLCERARSEGCARIDLESGVQRDRAHRFYFRHGMHVNAFHFTKAFE